LLLAACVFGASAVQAAPHDLPQPGSCVVDLPLSDGDVQRLCYRQPEQPIAALVLLVGGDGVLSMDGAGEIHLDTDSFLIRTRDAWIARGFAIAIPDVPSDRSTLRNSRLSRGYGDILHRIVAYVRTRTSVPIWLVGTSQGTNAAASGAAHMTQSEIAGVVLTSSLSRSGRHSSETVFGADLALITVPTLIVSHRGDRCSNTPPSDAERIRRALVKSPRIEVMMFDGGAAPRSDECRGESEHGYLGIEDQVLDRIAEWIKAP
jgi:pimeloyl-ACP methyl ester carboxylesterase